MQTGLVSYSAINAKKRRKTEVDSNKMCERANVGGLQEQRTYLWTTAVCNRRQIQMVVHSWYFAQVAQRRLIGPVISTQKQYRSVATKIMNSPEQSLFTPYRCHRNILEKKNDPKMVFWNSTLPVIRTANTLRTQGSNWHPGVITTVNAMLSQQPDGRTDRQMDGCSDSCL